VQTSHDAILKTSEPPLHPTSHNPSASPLKEWERGREIKAVEWVGKNHSTMFVW